MARPTIDDGHTCPLPGTRGERDWWSCPECGQLWRKFEGFWKLTPREAQQ